MIKKEAMAEKLDALAKEHSTIIWMDLYGIVRELKRKAPVKTIPRTEDMVQPDEKYFQYFIKTSWNMRYSEGLRPGTNWTAGRCFELPDGKVEVWCHDFIYHYDNIGDTYPEWDLD